MDKTPFDFNGLQRSATDWFDNAHYPYGFDRSGDYSIKEAEFLSGYGARLLSLTQGSSQPESDQEQQILAVIKGLQQPESFAEKTWMKYLRLTLARPCVTTVYRTPAEYSQATTYSADDWYD